MRESSGGARHPIGRWAEADGTVDGIRSDGVRNLIGQRTESDRAANAKKGGALVSSAPLTMLVALKSYLYCLDTLSICSDFVRKKGALIPPSAYNIIMCTSTIMRFNCKHLLKSN